MNQVTLMGRLTRDPELRHTQSGIPVASFSLAVDRRFGSKENRETDFIDIVAWRHTAEFVSKYFTKGRMCAVSGSLQIRQWQDKEGNNRRTAEVIAEQIYFAGDKPQGSGGGYGGDSYQPRDAGPPADSGFGPGPTETSDFAEIADDDGDLPL